MFSFRKKKRVFLDYAASTPVRPEVFRLMKPYLYDSFGNASAIHQEGVQARAAIESARARLARTLHVRSEGVVFTASGTESNNLALMGAVYTQLRQGRRYEDMEVVSTRIEHPSIGVTLRALEERGIRVHYVPVDSQGAIEASALKKVLSPQTVVVSFAYVNSEIGVVQDVSKLARIVHNYNREHGCSIYVHVDAAQAPLWLSCELDRLSVDLLSLDAGKCYGPKGMGVLAMRHGVTIAPVTYGGPQEQGLRPGTENTAAIVGGVHALVLAQESHQERSARIQEVRDAGIARLLQIEGCVLNGSAVQRVANNINVSVAGIDTEFAAIVLDEQGFAVSTKSACSGSDASGSTVVREMTGDEGRARTTLRITLGERTARSEVLSCADVLDRHVTRMRQSAHI